MIKVPISESTRKKAIEAIQSLESEKLIELVKVAKPNNYYLKTVDESLKRDREAAKSWMPREDRKEFEKPQRNEGAPESQKLASLVTRLEPVEVPRYGPPGRGRISKEYNHATKLTLGSALAQGDTLQVEQPRLNMNSKKTKEALEDVFSDGADLGSEDTSGGGYGF